MPGMIWNGDANCKLLLSILKTQDVKVDFSAVAEDLTTDTVTCTPRAVQEQLKKLKKMAKDGGGGGSPKPDGCDDATPKPGPTARGKKRTSDDADCNTPSEKTKKITPGKAKAIKTEVAAEDEAELPN